MGIENKDKKSVLTPDKQLALNAIEENKELILNVSDQIWEYAELSLQEFKSAALYCKVLKEEGFAVEENYGGIATGFTASYGSGRPYIGILGEYDALSGLSQRAGIAEREETIAGGNGHGCGHNLLGAGAMAAAIGIKAFLEKTKTSGTVIFYGCPGEEGGAAKAFWARDRYFDKLDAAFSWHPGDANEVMTGSTNACIQTQYHFRGIASHASGAPELGRSALDAVEIMNLGVQFLREHMTDKSRIHYAITDAGGVSPNVVQAHASVLYMVRSNHVSEAIALQERVDRIAQGAAMMTDTTVEKKFIDALSDTIVNYTLEDVLLENFTELGVPSYTEEELDYAQKLNDTYNGKDFIPGLGAECGDLRAMAAARDLRDRNGHAMNDFLLPLFRSEYAFRPGSSDVGDVSWETPVGQILVAAWPNGCPGHSWQNVACGKTSIGHKALLHAGKVLACAVIDIFKNPDLLAKAREEFKERTAEGFTSPIPMDAVPVIPDL